MALTLSQLPQSSSVVGYWPLNEATGSGNRADLSANALDLSAGVSLTQGTGHEGGSDKCVTFTNAANMRLDRADAAILDISGALTIAGWCRGDNWQTANNSALFGKGIGDATRVAYYVWVTDNSGAGTNFNLQGRVSSDGSTLITTTGSTHMTNATWFHVAMVYSPSTSVTLYLNGVQEVQNTTSIPASLHNSTQQLKLHCLDDNTGTYNGSMDEWVLWSTNLSAAEVLRVNNETVPSGGFFYTSI